jgi:hypothetical protein
LRQYLSLDTGVLMGYEQQREKIRSHISGAAGRANSAGQRVPTAASGIHTGTYRPGEDYASDSEPVDWSDWRNVVPRNIRITRKK